MKYLVLYLAEALFLRHRLGCSLLPLGFISPASAPLTGGRNAAHSLSAAAALLVGQNLR